MQQERPWLVEEDEDAADRQTASLAGVAITLLLLVVGLTWCTNYRPRWQSRTA